MTIFDKPQKSIGQMSYVEFMAFLGEVNRPPGGKKMLRLMTQNTFMIPNCKVLHIGSNTGSSTMEIAHLAKCHVIGVDKNKTMINCARSINKNDSYFPYVNFITADAQNLPFGDDKFDLVFSAGSMAFINNKLKAIQELIRVTKFWGFIADIVMFYHQKPPQKLINEMNKEMDIKIEPWDLSFWQKLYLKEGLENYYEYTEKMQPKTIAEVKNYCKIITNNISDIATRQEARKRLLVLMKLFNKNHKFLSCGLLIFRKRQSEEQKDLFGA